MPVEYGPHQPGDRLHGHEEEIWPAWHCGVCNQDHESDPRQGCVGWKRATPQPTLEEMQGKTVHGEIANNPLQGPGHANNLRGEQMRAVAKAMTPSLADRIAQGAPTSANPVLLDSIRMIVREELKGTASFTDREKYAITQGLKVVLSILAKGRTPEDEEVFPSDDALQALIERLEQ